tara:strand:+ start:133 stop:717 length:585 start_codon:yes stop_codon:yes gene_type:complete
MSEENEIFEAEKTTEESPALEVAETPEVVAPVKKKRTRKRTYTPEQREKMLANLKKGREASLKKRQAKKELKKEIKQNQKKVANDYVNEKLASEGRLLSKIDRLEAMIMKMNTPKPTPKPTAKPTPAPAPTPVEKPKPKPKRVEKLAEAPKQYVTLNQIRKRTPPSLKPKPVAKPIQINRTNLSTYKRKNKFGF